MIDSTAGVLPAFPTHKQVNTEDVTAHRASIYGARFFVESMHRKALRSSDDKLELWSL